MRYRTGLAIPLLLLALSGAAAAPSAPQSVSASYNILRNGGRVAVVHETFEASAGAYRIVSESHAVGLLALFAPQPLRVTSSGRLTGAGLSPQHFEGKRGADDPRQVRAEFDWQGERLVITRTGRTETLPLPPGTQDQLSIMYQFMFLAPDRPQLLEFSITNGRKLDHYRYTVRTGIEIETALGRMTTVHLVREHPPNESGVEIWLAPQQHYLPVRMIVLHEDGSRYEQVVTRLELKGAQQESPTPAQPPAPQPIPYSPEEKRGLEPPLSPGEKGEVEDRAPMSAENAKNNQELQSQKTGVPTAARP